MRSVPSLSLPFRIKIVLWYAAVLLLTLLLFRLVSVPVIRGSLYGEIDESLRAEAAWAGNLILEYRARRLPEEEIRLEIAERSGLSPRKEFIEIHGADGRIYFKSANLAEDRLSALHSDPFSEVVTVKSFRGHGLRLFALRRDEHTIFVGYPLTDIDAAIGDILSSFFYLVPLALVLAVGGGLFLVVRFVRPIGELERYAEDLVRTPLDRELPPSTSRRDEIGQLMAGVHAIVEAMRASTRRALSFASLASHELRTPLAVLRSQLEGALGEKDTTPARERSIVASTYDEVLRLSRIVDDLLTLGTLEAQTFRLELEPVEVETLLAEFAEEARALCETKSIDFHFKAFATGRIEVDQSRVRQVLFNVLDNAIKHTPAGGHVELSSRLDDGQAVVALSDDGEGIPPESLPRIFDFFYSARPSGGPNGRPGAGLGLPLVRRIVEAHRGVIEVASRVGEGTTVTIRLPLQRA